MNARGRATAALAGWALGAVGVLALLSDTPVRQDDSVSTAFELFRRGAMGVAWYVLAACAAGALARAARATAAVRVLDLVTIAPLRAAVALSVSSALTLATPAIAAPDDKPPIVTLERLPEQAPLPATTTTVAPGVTGGGGPGVRPGVGRGSARDEAAGPPPATTGAVWQVRSGDCFWTIADQVLTERAGRRVSDREVVPYWRQLIHENRARLRDPGNPDLLFPGQTLVLP